MNSQPSKFRFWQHQAATPMTPWQSRFDIFFGVIAPLICCILNPIRGIELGRWNFALYGGVAVASTAFLLWRWRFNRSPQAADGLFIGVFLMATLVAILVGILLFPLALLGLGFYGIGLLGFIPWVTASVFYGQASQAWVWVRGDIALPKLAFFIFVGALIALLVPIGTLRTARTWRPEVAQLPIHPAAFDIQLGELELWDSGFPWRKEDQFEVSQPRAAIEQYYEETLTQLGWRQREHRFDGDTHVSSSRYTYTSFSGQRYEMRVRIEPMYEEQTRVNLSLSYPKNPF